MRQIRKLIILFIILLIWGVGSYFQLWNSYIIPSPKRVFNAFVMLLENGKLLGSMGVSLKRVFIGFLISAGIALPMGIIFGLYNIVYEYFKYILEFLRHTPPLAMVPMIILWFGIGEVSKIVIIVLASFFPIFLNTLKGIRDCNKEYIEVGEVFGLSHYEIFKKIIFPNAIPDVLLGLKLGIGYSWRAIIAAELIASSAGIGYLILDAQQISRSDIVVVGIISIGVLGIITDFCFSSFMKGYLKNREGKIDERYL